MCGLLSAAAAATAAAAGGGIHVVVGVRVHVCPYVRRQLSRLVFIKYLRERQRQRTQNIGAGGMVCGGGGSLNANGLYI